MKGKIQFRVTEDEKQIIKEKSKQAGMKMSEYVRYTALGTTTIQIKTEIEGSEDA